MADNKKIFSQHMKECIEDCATKAKAVGLGRAEYLLQRLAEMLDEGGGSGGGVQPDWNENDAASPAHVLNRPFTRRSFSP